MKVIIAGGSGQIGSILARNFHAKGHEVVILSRNLYSAPWHVLQWDAKTIGDWARAIKHADVVLNMTGRSVNCRYNAKNCDLIM